MTDLTALAEVRVGAVDADRTETGTGAPEWWPPRSGDVAVFYQPVDGNDPIRVCVSYNYAERGWMNVATGLLLPHEGQPYPGDLTLLLRDGIHWSPSA